MFKFKIVSTSSNNRTYRSVIRKRQHKHIENKFCIIQAQDWCLNMNQNNAIPIDISVVYQSARCKGPRYGKTTVSSFQFGYRFNINGLMTKMPIACAL